MRAAGIVLCGGASRRMGWPKAVLPFGPELLVQRVVRLLGDAVRPVVVVAAPRQELPDLSPEARVVRDRSEGCGQLEGICAGLTALQGEADAAFVAGCDLPWLAPAFVRRMLELLGEYDIVSPVEDDRRHPLASVYRSRVLPHVERLLAAGRRRPALLYETTATRFVPVELLRDADPQLRSLVNMNRPEDYLDALRWAGYAAPSEVLEKIQPPPPCE